MNPAPAYKAHRMADLAPSEPDAPTVVSLFAGCGGSSLGWKMAGFDVIAAVEWDPEAAATYSRNMPAADMTIGDITKINAASLPDSDVLDGSPPCQAFSTSGNLRLDERADLFNDYLRIADAKRPKVLVAENVAGLIRGHSKGRFMEIQADFKKLGYQVAVRVLDAQWLGVPQARRRLIWIATGGE